jgi:uncharacterized protein YjbI with pentapeptide repeats
VIARKHFRAYTMGITAEHEKALASELKSMDRPSRRDLRDALENHSAWLDSTNDALSDDASSDTTINTGARADFSGKNLEYAELVDARLTDAFLQKTNLKGADLTLADLRGATLVQANLTDTNLLGTQLQ